jgi:hypothetical protein
MVMNSFEKRNFMQPMGRPKDALKVPYIFSFLNLRRKGRGGRWGDVFSFFLASQCVFTMFHQSSNEFP